MEQLLALLNSPKYLTAFAGFLASVIAAFVAGYMLGRARRAREAAAPILRAGRAPRGEGRVALPGLRDPGDMARLPEIGGDEARLMDLTAIRAAESEPPPPLDLGPPPRRR